ncbi:hypothetical protein J1614_005330 [Plenodomus biglobosus]|nr:hypothetical protein J1614_005330 [Plenodomus biglobosus]
MHTLAPDENEANLFFEKIVAYSMQRGVENPTISENQAEARQWLEDSLRILTKSVISGDSNIASGVRAELLKDVQKYESENGLNQNLSAAERASNIVSKQAEVLDEASRWMTSEGKNLDKAWSGASLYQWVSEAFDNIQEKYESSKTLKGLFTTSFVSPSLPLSSFLDISSEDHTLIIIDDASLIEAQGCI